MVSMKWLSHAGWLIKFKDSTVVIDPYLNNNPKAVMKPADLTGIDYVIVTHEHFDHIGDSFEIAKNNHAKFVSIFETGQAAQKAGIPEGNVVGMNIGSDLIDLGKIKVAFTPAVHSGNEHGVIIQADNHTIYHAGDTALFTDMKLIKQLYHPDIAMLPIGGFFTMSPREAAMAAKYIGAKKVLPMHYNTFPPIVQDAKKFAKMVKGSQVIIFEPGEEKNL